MTSKIAVSVEEAAAMLGISRGSAYEAVRRGEIPSLRIGRRVLVPLAALSRLCSDPAFTAGPETGSPPTKPSASKA